MPVVLDTDTWPAWLGEEPGDARQLKAMLAWPVSQRVGNVNNNRAGRSAMRFSSWLAAVFVLLILVGCAVGQGPPPPAPPPHDNGADIRDM
jgi:hypothetical protein